MIIPSNQALPAGSAPRRRRARPAAVATAAGLLLIPAAGMARPITYPGGTSAMLMHDPTMSMTSVDYTLTPRLAIGAAAYYDREDDVTTAGPTVTRGFRWNAPDSQANLYINGGAGGAVVDRAVQPAAWAGISADWEDRRWYTQAGSSLQAIAGGPDRVRNTARVGVAPYVAEAGQLHSWLMLQADHTPGTRETWSLTPLVRQFYGTHLWEAGISTRGGVTLTYTKTF